jgi:hypothetical protein
MDTENSAKNKLCPYTMMRNNMFPILVNLCLYVVILEQLTDFEYSSVQELFDAGASPLHQASQRRDNRTVGRAPAQILKITLEVVVRS